MVTYQDRPAGPSVFLANFQRVLSYLILAAVKQNKVSMSTQATASCYLEVSLELSS